MIVYIKWHDRFFLPAKSYQIQRLRSNSYCCYGLELNSTFEPNVGKAIENHPQFYQLYRCCKPSFFMGCLGFIAVLQHHFKLLDLLGQYNSTITDQHEPFPMLHVWYIYLL